MEIQVKELAKRAVQEIKSKWGLPESGLLAGGSIANLVWEYHSGNKAKINDIDIFQFVGLEEKPESGTNKKSLFQWEQKDERWYEDYRGMMNFDSYTKNFYKIVESQTEGNFNHITYRANTEDPKIIIDSFDINATRIGYSIDRDEYYWTPDFEEFLKTGKLKSCNVSTPCHTAVRIAKKSKELNAIVDEFEFKILQHSIMHRFVDRIKFRFKERYLDLYEANKDILLKYFQIGRDKESEDWVRMNHGIEVNLYYLKPVVDEKVYEVYEPGVVFDDPNLNRIFKSTDFLFYVRNVMSSDERLKEYWKKLSFFFSDGYVDINPSEEDLELLCRFVKYAPESINNLRGLKISTQISLIKKFFEKFSEDPLVAISILETHKFEKEPELDEETCLLLELSVRKKIINDTRGKVKKILNIQPDEDLNKDIDTFCF
jgi:hypothetical protein